MALKISKFCFRSELLKERGKCHRVYEKVIGLWAEVTFQKGHKRTDWTLSWNSLGTYKARPKIASNSSWHDSWGRSSNSAFMCQFCCGDGPKNETFYSPRGTSGCCGGFLRSVNLSKLTQMCRLYVGEGTIFCDNPATKSCLCLALCLLPD